MSEYTIESQFIEAVFSSEGAECQSLYDKELGIEYLWQGDEKFWSRRSPILFPIVGRLNQDRYRVGRKYFHMSRHGFARDSEFELVRHEKDSIAFRLTSNEETLRLFPFKFVLDVFYKLYGPVLTVTYEIKCPERRDIYFSVGSHPAINVPTGEGTLEDYFLEFEMNEVSGPFYLHNDLVDFDQKPELGVFDGKKLYLSEKLFEQDALIFKDIRSQKISLRNTINDREVVFDIGETPYLGLWKAPGAGFICIEPWYGVSDVLGAGDDYLKKEGVIHLDIGETFKSSYSIHIK